MHVAYLFTDRSDIMWELNKREERGEREREREREIEQNCVMYIVQILHIFLLCVLLEVNKMCISLCKMILRGIFFSKCKNSSCKMIWYELSNTKLGKRKCFYIIN